MSMMCLNPIACVSMNMSFILRFLGTAVILICCYVLVEFVFCALPLFMLIVLNKLSCGMKPVCCHCSLFVGIAYSLAICLKRSTQLIF
jgi:hypothetical protein